MEDRIKRVLNHIENNLQSSMELKDLASLACLSPSQFHRQFKRQTGRTPFSFVEELKMNKAHQLIMQENWMVYELSDHFGYKDYETFSRAVKKYFHFSPDDLKSIVEGIRLSIDSSEEQELMILTLDDYNKETEVVTQLKAFLKDKNVKMTDLKQAQVFKIVPKSKELEKTSLVLKNKFALTEEKKLWEALIESK